jgi:hypothetical protein
MRLSAVVILGLSFGCAHPNHAQRPAAASLDEEAPAPSEAARSVRLVARRPAHYKFVGRVRATAPNDDFVLAAKQAREKLSRRAEALGADVIKIERVDPCYGPALHGQVMMAGRAYRLAD